MLQWQMEIWFNQYIKRLPHKVGIFNDNLGITLKNIAKSFQTFAEDFAKVESNYLHSPILNNTLFGDGKRGVHIFDDRFF